LSPERKWFSALDGAARSGAYLRISKSALKRSSSGTRRTPLKPASARSSRTRASGMSYVPSPAPPLCERGRHAVEDACTVEEGAERTDVLLETVGAVDLKQEEGTAGGEGAADRAEQPERVRGVVDHVEGGDQVIRLRQPVLHVAHLEADAPARPDCRGVGAGELDLVGQDVEADELRGGKGGSQLQHRTARSAADIGDPRPTLQPVRDAG
jgi:hypothetical protein